MAIINIPTNPVPSELVDQLPAEGMENHLYSVLNANGDIENYRYIGGAWEEVGHITYVYNFLFDDFQGSVQDTVSDIMARVEHLEAEVFHVRAATTVYADGTLIINEISSDREHNKAEHGNVIAEYEPLGESNPYIFTSRENQPWRTEREAITKVMFGSTVRPTQMCYWFQGCKALKEIDWTNLDGGDNITCRSMLSDCAIDHLSMPYMPKLETIRYICRGCKSLTYALFNQVKASNITDTADAFQGCYSLTEVHLVGLSGIVETCERMFANIANDGNGDMILRKIYADGKLKFWQASESTNMFRSCTSLVGGRGTVYRSDITNKDYARIDKDEERGYFTEA